MSVYNFVGQIILVLSHGSHTYMVTSHTLWCDGSLSASDAMNVTGGGEPLAVQMIVFDKLYTNDLDRRHSLSESDLSVQIR